MVLTVRAVGKVPFARNVFDRTTWRRVPPSPSFSSPCASSCPSLRLRRGPGSQLTSGTVTLSLRTRPALPRSATTEPSVSPEDPLRAAVGDCLNQSEFASLTYYVSEYHLGHVSVDGLVLALKQLLAAPRHRPLLGKVGPAVVRAEDRERFAALAGEREAEPRRKEVREGLGAVLLRRN